LQIKKSEMKELNRAKVELIDRSRRFGQVWTDERERERESKELIMSN
jgi:hypothetical protein